MHARALRFALASALLVGCGDTDPSGNTTDEPGDTSGTTDPSSTTTTPDTTATTSTSTSAPTSTASDPSDTTSDPATTGTDPTDPTDTTTGDTGEACVDDHRIVAFLANWADCPTADQLAQYSHVIIAFAVTYAWTPDGNVCDETCTIAPVAGCNGAALDQLVADLHAEDIEVLVSFGGAGMGGVWEGTCGEMTRCWDHCVDQVDSVVEQLTAIVGDNDLDGVDIDYEYCLHDAAHIAFVEDLTTGLRTALDTAFPGDPKLVTHAPMDSELDAGDPYYTLLADVAPAIDFLMPQYYNGGRDPFTPDGLDGIHQHYTALVDDLFGGDASKVVFGYCIEDGCQPVATQPAALGVVEQVDAWYPDNGGMFFWAHPDDQAGWFSQPIREHYDATVCDEDRAPEGRWTPADRAVTQSAAVSVESCG